MVFIWSLNKEPIKVELFYFDGLSNIDFYVLLNISYNEYLKLSKSVNVIFCKNCPNPMALT